MKSAGQKYKTEFNKEEDSGMGKVTLEQVREEIKELSHKEREKIFSDLLESDILFPATNTKLPDEFHRRIKEIDQGTVECRDVDDVIAEIEE